MNELWLGRHLPGPWRYRGNAVTVFTKSGVRTDGRRPEIAGLPFEFPPFDFAQGRQGWQPGERNGHAGPCRFSRAQVATIATGRGRHRKYFPYTFTEQRGIMAASVMNPVKAVRRYRGPDADEDVRDAHARLLRDRISAVDPGGPDAVCVRAVRCSGPPALSRPITGVASRRTAEIRGAGGLESSGLAVCVRRC